MGDSRSRMKYIVALMMVILLALPAQAGVMLDINADNQVVAIQVETPDPIDVKGLRFVKKVPYINEAGKKKKKKQYSYELNNGNMYITETLIPGVPDLTKFDEVHPRFARIREYLQVAGTVLSFAVILSSILILFL